MNKSDEITILGVLDISFHRAHRVEDNADPEIQRVTTNVSRSSNISLTSIRENEYQLPFKVGDGLAIHTFSNGTYPVKLEIRVGGVNAACPSQQQQQQQDYFVTPGQEWIDGWQIENERARQFVVARNAKFSLANIAPDLVVEEGMEKCITIDIVTADGPVLYRGGSACYERVLAPDENENCVPVTAKFKSDDEQYEINNVRPSDTVWRLKCCIRDKCNISPHDFDIMGHLPHRRRTSSMGYIIGYSQDFEQPFEDNMLVKDIGMNKRMPWSVDCQFKQRRPMMGASPVICFDEPCDPAITAAGKIKQTLFTDNGTTHWDTVRYKRITIRLTDVNSVRLPEIESNGGSRAKVDERTDRGSLKSVLTTSDDPNIYGREF